MKGRSAFTIVEILYVVTLVGLLTAMSIPSVHRTRLKSHEFDCLKTQRFIEAAKERFAMEERKSNGYEATWDEIMPYMQPGVSLTCPGSPPYNLERIGDKCYCPIHDLRTKDVW